MPQPAVLERFFFCSELRTYSNSISMGIPLCKQFCQPQLRLLATLNSRIQPLTNGMSFHQTI
jgi:hypothetical protein